MKWNLGSENALIDKLNTVLDNSDIPYLCTYFGIKEFYDDFSGIVHSQFSQHGGNVAKNWEKYLKIKNNRSSNSS